MRARNWPVASRRAYTSSATPNCAQISRVSLRPLAREHIGEFLSDTLGQSEESVAPLTELMLQKTGGNPFFAGEFLKTLYQEQLITLSEKRQWGWNIDLIRAKPGMTLLHVIAMTKALGALQSPKDEQPEVFRWTDAGESHVTCTFTNGRLTQWALHRPSVADEPPASAPAAPPADPPAP